MKAHVLNEAIKQGQEDAAAHEERLAGRFQAALEQIGRIAARRFSRRADSLTAAAPSPESTMIAVYPTPDEARALAQPNGEPAEVIHVTLAFLGKTDPDQAEAAAAIAAQVAADFPAETLEGVAGGIAAFGSETGMLSELARIAGLVAPDGGYGQTLWNPALATVLWIPADWTTDDEAEAAAQAFLAVPEVAAVEVADSESAVPDDPDWTLVWANGGALVEASYPSIVLPDVPGLAELRHAVCEALAGAGMPYAENHGWTPHLTIDYLPEPLPPPASLLGLPLTFGYLSVARGDVARDFPLGAPGLTAAGPPDWSPPHDDEVINVDDVIGRLRTKADPVRRAAIKAAAMPALDKAGINWDVTNPFVQGVLEKTGAEIAGIADTTRLNVLRIIRDGYEQGLSITDTATAIQEGMAAAAPARARLIARTEMASLQNGGAVAAGQIVAQATGLDYAKRWLTAPGAEHPRHEDYDGLDGQTVALDDLFDVGGANLAYPGDPDGPPEEICNCRCAVEMVELPGAGPEVDLPPELEDAASELAGIELDPVAGTDASELASAVVAGAKAMEPALTKIMRATIEPKGGVLDGLAFRLKSKASMERKINLVADQAHVPLAASARTMKDGARYTAVFGPKDYVPKMTQALDDLRRAGIVPDRISATWKAGSPYAGTNVILRAPNGFRFELQFHTPESLKTKQIVNHPLYEKWRQLEPGSAEAKRLEEQMVANADAVLRPQGITTWKYEESVEADIGVTPFRAGDDPIGFYDSDKYKRFQQDVEESARAYGVTIDDHRQVSGIWEGTEEPSVSLKVHDGELGVRAFAANLGRAYDQDGVLLFRPHHADSDVIATFGSTKAAQEKVFDAMREVGLPAGRFTDDGRLQVIGSGKDFVGKLDVLAARLNVGYDADVGRFVLLEKANGDYEAAIRDFGGTPGEQVRAGERGAGSAEPGRTPLGPGAGGSEAGAQEVAGVARGAPDPAKAATLSVPAVPPVPKPLTPAQIKRLGTDKLWEQLAALGKIENLARAEVADEAQAPIVAELWRRGDARLPKGTVRYNDLAGDVQVHSTYSDGHQSIGEMALAASDRGQKQLVISDHAHLLTPDDIKRQHAEIEELNYNIGGDFRVIKGVEANILSDGTLDLSDELLAKFDHVNAAIHAPIQALGGQTTLFAESNTDRILRALDNPRVNVLVHPHSVDADWERIARKAAERNVALEINGRDMLRNGRQDAAAAMIRAGKEAGAKFVIGSDAHTTEDLIDQLYAVRFAAKHGVTAEDIAPLQRRRVVGTPTPEESLPGDNQISLSSPNVDALGDGGNMNAVYKTEINGEEFVVKPQPDLDVMAEDFGTATVRANITPGNDLERERAAYVVSRYFNAIDPDFQVYVPPYRISEVIDQEGGHTPAGIASFIEGEVGQYAGQESGLNWPDLVGAEELRPAALYDAVIGNTDRHAGNFLIGEDGHLWLIDHGLAFPEFADPGQFQNEYLVDRARYLFKTNLTPREVKFLEQLRGQWDEIRSDLAETGLPANALNEMKDRLDYMLSEKTRLPWPHGSDLWESSRAPGTATRDFSPPSVD